LLGVLYAALGAFTFALNNVTMRRGVVTGSVLQGMALTVPIGGVSFLVPTIVFGELHHLVLFPMAALAWLACQGVVHFVFGRYCNYKSSYQNPLGSQGISGLRLARSGFVRRS
jgi:drug/metabolite transporter (DMT)-like permease